MPGSFVEKNSSASAVVGRMGIKRRLKILDSE
jgi:hypothetical protein